MQRHLATILRFKKADTMATNTVKGLLSKLSSSSRDLWERQFGNKEQSTQELCEHLLTLRGESSAILVADEIIERLEAHTPEQSKSFFNYLLDDMAPDHETLSMAAKAYLENPNPETASILDHAGDAPRMRLFRMLATSPRGARALVDLRAVLRGILRANPHLRPVDQGLVHLFRSWFNRGFLKLRAIDWNTPAVILEKLIAYEAVHEIQGWDDLRRRLASDRRCYAFFHPALEDEPLIFVEVALLDEMASNIQDVIQQDPADKALNPNTAIFYSISNCQPGLAGVSFGNYLIKQVVKNLTAELPELKTFATLSPVPGFRKWVEANYDLDDAQTTDDSNMNQLCAHYLINEKRRSMPLDPVARFHLGNGAGLERINWKGDTSDNGHKQSYGLMVNYVYDISKVEKNHEALVNEGVIATTSAIQKLASAAKKPNKATAIENAA